MPDGHGVFCTNCGTLNQVEQKGTTGAIKACSKCKKQIVTVVALLAHLNLYPAEVGLCSKCKTGQLAEHTYCFACGKEWRKK